VYIYGSYHKIKTGYLSLVWITLYGPDHTNIFNSLTTMVHNKTYYIGTGT